MSDRPGGGDVGRRCPAILTEGGLSRHAARHVDLASALMQTSPAQTEDMPNARLNADRMPGALPSPKDVARLVDQA
jgi:hypothetical protein